MKNLKILIFLILVGCADGPKFKREQLTKDDAVIYFYRENFRGAALSPHKIMEASTNKCVATLLPGGYYPYVTKPGEKTFFRNWQNETAKISLKVEANQEYFIMSTYDTIPFRFFRSPELVNVSKEEALKEIEDKRLSIVKN